MTLEIIWIEMQEATLDFRNTTEYKKSKTTSLRVGSFDVLHFGHNNSSWPSTTTTFSNLKHMTNTGYLYSGSLFKSPIWLQVSVRELL